MNVLSNAFKYTHEGGNIEVLLKTGHNDAYRGALKDYFEIDTPITESVLTKTK